MRRGKSYRLWALTGLLLTATILSGQNKPAQIWATVQLNKSSVMVGEPLMVTITVYTSTWFTEPPAYGEIQVPEAIMVDFQQRSGSMRKTVGNKSYPAIEKKYVVYPLKEGSNSLPSLSIGVTSPPEGDYKGKKRTIQSPERSFEVRKAEGIILDPWLTANRVTLKEEWSRDPSVLKQGDVIDRTIRISASGSLAALIPPLKMPEAAFGNTYSKPVSLNNVQTEQSFNGSRTETWTYLVEKAGSFTIPGIEVNWFNPRSGRLESTQIPSRKIEIAENPDMDFLLSMQDSLQAMLNTEAATREKAPFEWMGLNWWQLLVIVLSLVALGVLLYRLYRNLSLMLTKRKMARLESEEQLFRNFEQMAGHGSPQEVYKTLMDWYDRFRPQGTEASFDHFVCRSGNRDLGEQYQQLKDFLIKQEMPAEWTAAAFGRHVRAARENILDIRHRPMETQGLPDLNP